MTMIGSITYLHVQPQICVWSYNHESDIEHQCPNIYRNFRLRNENFSANRVGRLDSKGKTRENWMDTGTFFVHLDERLDQIILDVTVTRALYNE